MWVDGNNRCMTLLNLKPIPCISYIRVYVRCVSTMVTSGKFTHVGVLINRRCRVISIFTCVLLLAVTAIVYTSFDQEHQFQFQAETYKKTEIVVRKGISKLFETFKERYVSASQVQRIKQVVTENCTHFPSPPAGRRWPEEEFIHDPKPTDVRDIVDPGKSRVWLEGPSTVLLGNVIRLRIELYNGYGKRKTKGGDLVRVWMKEEALGASSNGHVVDNGDGSYVTTFHAMWVGKPQIRVFVITPREVIAAQFRRRYICPPVLVNTAIFVHGSKGEETPCNFNPQVPGYPELCNLTELNFGHPWFCGKPRLPGFTCDGWEMAADKNHLINTMSLVGLSPIEQVIVKKGYNARSIPHNITVEVSQVDSKNTRITAAERPCNEIDIALTWQPVPPRGYMYTKVWQNRHCSAILSDTQIRSCLNNTNIQIIGDSTTNQIYEGLIRKIPCKVIKKETLCVNDQLKYNLIKQKHMLPMCIAFSPRTEFESYTYNLGNIETTQRTILIVHTFSHQLNFHSHVFRETLYNLKKALTELLQRHTNVFVVIKGPHSYAINKDTKTIMLMPDKYADIYQDMIFELFSEFKDKVMYLDVMDITVSTEQWFIHPENYIVDNLVNNILAHASDSKNTRITTAERPCNEIDKASTWQSVPPRGYMYNKVWQNRHCSAILSDTQIRSCLNNTNIQIIGDSTTNQIYEGLIRKIPCKVIKKETLCVNDQLKYNLIKQKHMLPMCIAFSPRTEFESYTYNLGSIETTQRTILIVHTFSHQLNFHSHVFRETLYNLKKAITELLQRHTNVFVVIKGPHSYAINKDTKTIMWMPDKYADIYQDMIFELFSEFKDKVMYLDVMDITVSTEQWFIHPENYIVDNLVNNILAHACRFP